MRKLGACDPRPSKCQKIQKENKAPTTSSSAPGKTGLKSGRRHADFHSALDKKLAQLLGHGSCHSSPRQAPTIVLAVIPHRIEPLPYPADI
eukprot:scaffold86086_cov30-Prasinocladus_malaysianus.AAC.1